MTSSSSPLRSLPVQLAVLGALSLLLLFAQLGTLGVWEPWEAREILTAMEYGSRPAFDASIIDKNPSASGYNWAVPTLDGKPVATSLLKIWLLDALLPAANTDIRELVGTLERNARLPTALLCLLLSLGTFTWLRRHATALQAGLSSVALITMPVLFIGAHNLSTPLLFLATTSLALIAAFELITAKNARHKWIASTAMTLALVLCVLDQRLISAMLILSILSAFALIEIPFTAKEHDATPPLRDLIIGALIFVAPALGLGAMLLTADSYDAAIKTLSEPHARQLLMLCVPITSAMAALFVARRTHVVRALASPQGIVPLIITVAILILLGHSYGEVNPTLLKRGEIFGQIPSLGFLLGHTVDAQSLAREHFRLDLWVRQIGFATFPWAALVPAGLAHLAKNMRSPELEPAKQEQPLTPHLGSLQRFLITWAFIALFFMAGASTQNHYFYPAYLPLAIGCGMLLGDVAFWRDAARTRPILPYLVGMSAVAIVLMLGKDLERYPHRFIEVYAEMPKKLELPEGFSWGKTYKPMKYVMLVTLILGFFGPASWAVLQLDSLKMWRERWGAWRKKETALFAPITPEGDTPLEARAKARQALLAGESSPSNPLGKMVMPLVRLLERPVTRGILLAGVFTLFAIMTLFSYIPQATYHFSQRHIFESYLESSSPEEPLVGYQIPKNRNALYLRDIKTLSSSRELIDAMRQDSRFFGVIPRSKLAQVNMTVRQQLERNINVLNADSSKLVLISNKLDEGQQDQNFIASQIIDPTNTLPDEIQHPVKFENESGQSVHPTFDQQLEFLGYSLNKPGARQGDQAPLYHWGDEIELTMYFRVKARVPGNQQFFVHIDTAGNRLHGDHYPLGGDFPTNTWLPGDIVKDTHTIPVENYSKVGNYTLNFGFYVGKNRMKIAPPKAHRKDNRMTIGAIRVSR